MIFVLWFIPAKMVLLTGINEWTMLYLPILVVTLLWGSTLNNNIFSK